ncbi:TetR family transcriptional regulator OS=Streptomyces glaucescens OX=1907 GN=SGLAU_31580 PE=4 SV=1 [Streptomyces glaucescens]
MSSARSSIESFQDDRTLWLATVEARLQAEHSDDLRRHPAASQAQGRQGLAALLLGTSEDDVGDAAARPLGAAQMALFTGLTTQWLTEPGQAPEAAGIVAGLHALTGIVDAQQ